MEYEHTEHVAAPPDAVYAAIADVTICRGSCPS
jgi:carbon monoxide dehydrogenase subunit G